MKTRTTKRKLKQENQKKSLNKMSKLNKRHNKTFKRDIMLLFADSISKLSYWFLRKSGHALYSMFVFQQNPPLVLVALWLGSGWKCRAYSVPYKLHILVWLSHHYS